MKLLRTVIRIARRAAGQVLYVRRDERTGMLTQNFLGKRIFLRRRSDYLSVGEVAWLCENVYFSRYTPTDNGCVVDVGAGYGHEAVWLHCHSPGVKYYGIEVQPSIYECLANTFYHIGESMTAVPYAISSDGGRLFISSEADYVRASTHKGYVEVGTQTWEEFKQQFSIQEVDLLKVNIEGAEVALMAALGDLKGVRRVIISAHDFRADEGDGEYFRTREVIVGHLQSVGFSTEPLAEEEWLRDWIFGVRRDPQEMG